MQCEHADIYTIYELHELQTHSAPLSPAWGAASIPSYCNSNRDIVIDNNVIIELETYFPAIDFPFKYN